MRRSLLIAAGLLPALLLLPSQTLASPIIDTFEDGTTEGWVVNRLGMASHPAPPRNVPTGGPAGADDNYLLLTAVGGPTGSGSRLTAMNGSDWAFDYVAAGITSISMDARNFGGTDLFLRLVFEDPLGGPPSNIAFSTDPVFLAAGGGWISILFPILPGNLTAGVGTVADALGNATLLRIYHSQAANFPNPSTPIDPVVAQLGLDNIATDLTAVPEPGSVLLLVSGLAALSVRRRMRGLT